jgi:hypothetical protein
MAGDGSCSNSPVQLIQHCHCFGFFLDWLHIIFYRVTYQAATSNIGQASASHRAQDHSSFSVSSASRHRHKASTPSVIPIPSGGGKRVSTVESRMFDQHL